jgi:hypothetical protein
MDPIKRQLMRLFRQRVEEEVRAGSLLLINLSEYAVGSPHYERLMAQVAHNRRWQWPSNGYQVNI